MNSPHLKQLTGTLSTIAAGETVVVNPATGRFYSLSSSAALVWAALAQPRTPAETVQTVLAQHAHPPVSAAAELATFLNELRREGLVVPALPGVSIPLPASTNLVPYKSPEIHRGALSQAANGVSGTDDGQTTGFGTPLLS